MSLQRGPGRILKLLLAAVVADRMAVTLPPMARFPLVFLAVLLADSLRVRGSGESPLFLEDVVSGVLLYAGVGLLAWGLDHALSLYTSRHASPILPAVLLAVIDRAFPTSKRR